MFIALFVIVFGIWCLFGFGKVLRFIAEEVFDCYDEDKLDLLEITPALISLIVFVALIVIGMMHG